MTTSLTSTLVPIIGSAVFATGYVALLNSIHEGFTNAIITGSMLLVFSGIFTFLVDAYPLYAASALAANSFTRSSFAAAFPLFGVQSGLPRSACRVQRGQ